MTKHKAKSPGKTKGKDIPPVDIKETPLSFPEFAAIDHNKVLPRYSSVLRRSDQDGIGLEDIDTLQVELEALLASTVVRKLTLKEETKYLNNLEKYKGQAKGGKRPNQDDLTQGPGSPGRKGCASKKFKSLSGKPSSDSPSGKIVGIPKTTKTEATPAFDPLQNEQIRPLSDTSKPTVPKNETPNRFWTFVEPYCAPITQDDIKLLEDLIQTHSDLSDYYRVPPLGQHYTERWAIEDLENERSKGTVSNEKDDASDEKNDKILKKGENLSRETPAFFDLTQRLVAGLMEENVMTSVDENIDGISSNKKKKKEDGDDTGDDESCIEGKTDLIRSLNVSNANSLEARVRKELEDQGILDETENKESGPDEILDELKRCQSELKAVSSHNLQQLKRLLQAAKDEISRQELRNRLQEADNDVMEAYKKISLSRSKKKVPTKKERDFAWKSLKERELILKQLESI